jgi:hypothetical protein
MAGKAAEIIGFGDDGPWSGWVDDEHCAERLAAALQPDGDANSMREKATEQSVELLLPLWFAVEELAGRLLAAGRLEGDEIRRILARHMPPPPA